MSNINTARYQFGGSGLSNTAALCFGGDSPTGQSKTITEQWNGTSWTEVADLATGGAAFQGAGQASTNALRSSGNVPTGQTTVSEEWNDPAFIIKTVTVS